ncbi:lipid transfer-like protein VAS [Chenopodium quinoa]|uniref:Bifunctional inhibitor/plant lipid transfer protein/seed storage helical domain-containing protein n=1 Tax=Chenopodium quinoa TaxID=63459 RepID=A0A803MCT1_CHEQI|nr:lipid transfer-like protein VAS [Chenopodium quinoa]
MAYEKVMMIMVVFAVMLVSTHAQDPSTSCIQALMPCAQFINATTNPPPMCCGPLTEAFKTQVPCLCNIFENPELATTYHVNMTQAMELPTKCGIKNVDTSLCKKVKGAAPTKSPVAGGETTTSSESSPSPAGKSAANIVKRAGPISSLMLVLAGLMFY